MSRPCERPLDQFPATVAYLGGRQAVTTAHHRAGGRTGSGNHHPYTAADLRPLVIRRAFGQAFGLNGPPHSLDPAIAAALWYRYDGIPTVLVRFSTGALYLQVPADVFEEVQPGASASAA